jgi:LPXTG-motif cell wall-anchored protein
MKLKFLLIGIGVVALLALLIGTTSAQSAGDPVQGKAEWAQLNCKSCHGANGEGKYAGPRAGDGKTAADWNKQVRQPRAKMPAYRPDQASDQQITDMWAYMQTLPKPASFKPEVAVTAAGDPPGKILMAQNRCVSCHGFGEGLVKAAFTDRGRQVTYEAVLKQMRDPRQRMPIFGPEHVSNEQVQQIADFLASHQTAAPAAAAPAAAAPQAPAPATLPVTGGDMLSLPAALGLAGVGLGLWIRRRW